MGKDANNEPSIDKDQGVSLREKNGTVACQDWKRVHDGIEANNTPKVVENIKLELVRNDEVDKFESSEVYKDDAVNNLPKGSVKGETQKRVILDDQLQKTRTSLENGHSSPVSQTYDPKKAFHQGEYEHDILKINSNMSFPSSLDRKSLGGVVIPDV